MFSSYQHRVVLLSCHVDTVYSCDTGLRYDVEHHGDYAYMVTNLGGCKNNRLMKCLLTHLPWPKVTVEGADKVKQQVSCYK